MIGRRITAGRILVRLRRIVRNDHLILSLLALLVGAAGGGAVIVLREGIDLTQLLFYDSATKNLYAHAQDLPWWRLLLAPTAGGLMVGVFVYYFMPGRRPQGVADVIEASALRGGVMSAATGVRAAVASALSIGAGASVGREGPAVHLGASLAGWLATRLHLSRSMSRTLLGCGVATAVAASFNAPIAGALFASEVVIGNYALKAFAPVVIASVTGTAISRAYFGDFPAFVLQEHPIASLWEVPAFAGLGILAGIGAAILIYGIAVAEKAATLMPVKPWFRPAVGGLLVGTMALALPHVLGVGYGTTEAALLTTLPLWLLVAVGATKILATSVNIGFGFGGGVFSPSLVIGAMLGGAFGIIATDVFPYMSSGPSAYTIIGMGAMTAAVLGAPISTTLIIFELTGDYALTMAVMVAVSVSSVIAQQFGNRSFFTWQLQRRGLNLSEGFEAALLKAVKVRRVMSTYRERVSPDMKLEDLRTLLPNSAAGQLFVVGENGELHGTITLADLSEVVFEHDFDSLINAMDVARLHPPVLAASDDLQAALAVMRENGEEHIPVVEDPQSMTFLGCVHERDVMNAYNRALLKSRREEHD